MFTVVNGSLFIFVNTPFIALNTPFIFVNRARLVILGDLLVFPGRAGKQPAIVCLFGFDQSEGLQAFDAVGNSTLAVQSEKR